MRTSHIIVVLAILALFLASCREITVRTVVHENGSFTRIITITGDSSEVLEGNLPFPIDSSWNMTFGKDTSNSENFIATYSKDYKNSRILNKEIESDTSWRKTLNRKVDVKRKFGFFFSYLEFKEIYPAANPFRELNYRDYLSDEEMQWITGRKIPVTHADSSLVDSLGDKAWDFIARSAAAEVVRILQEGIHQLNDPMLDPEKVTSYTDSIKIELENLDFKSADTLIDYYASWTGDTAVYRLHELNPPIFREFDKKFNSLDPIIQMEGYREEAELPGLITATNSAEVTGNVAAWDVHLMTFLLDDFLMYAESRIINVWAFIVSGVVLLLLMIVLIARAFK